ncbi:MAG: DNA polymerase III subunit delta' [Bacteroidetes bacterium RIFCSPLOWO2_12_FULL_35_15]|nr:MAG: DNA polymerase III subunit delta' [Bacteroidetes bacterium RIFCSPLOWO2_12_FULL_35_15]
MLFSEIIGQQTIKERLIRSVNEGRISHAQLFLGPQGSGSLALALAYAQYISCKNKLEADSCGVCPSCVKYNKLVHPDLHFVYPVALSKNVKTSTDLAAEWREAFLDNPYITLFNWFELLEAENKQAVIGVEESAETLRKLSLTTYEAEYKIMIIWQAEKMNQQAANKLLKILEEPPDKTLFLLVCENEDQLLRTIVSRTQLIKILKISDRDLTQALVERNGISPEDAEKTAHLADGNYAEALLLIRENENAGQNLMRFQKLMRASLKFDPKAVLAWIDEVADAGRERQKNFLNYSLHIVRESLVLNYGDASLVKLGASEQEFVQKFSPFIHSSNTEQFIEELNKAHYHMERNANAKILFMDLAFKFNELLNLPKAG